MAGGGLRWGETVRSWHPWGGVFFAVALGCMFLKWFILMKLYRDDRAWLRSAHRYAVHDESGLPEADRFTAGQKTLFWIQSLCALMLFASGIILWFPEAMARGLRLTAIVLHPAVAIVSMGGIIVHIYMATAATPDSFRSMIRGGVSSRWAASHHPKWYRRVFKN